MLIANDTNRNNIVEAEASIIVDTALDMGFLISRSMEEVIKVLSKRLENGLV